jgi:hypothetical protein
MPLDAAEATRLLNASLALAAYTAPTSPMKLKLMTANGNATTAGTEVVNAGGSTYAAQTLAPAFPASATNGAINNSAAAVTFANMPAEGSGAIVGVEIVDSNGTPRRHSYGALTVPKGTNLGDSIALATGQLALTLA